MHNSASFSITDYLECGTLYARQNIIRKLKGKNVINSDNEADDIINLALLNQEIKLEGNEYCYECSKESKTQTPEPEKKLPLLVATRLMHPLKYLFSLTATLQKRRK